jgi:signal transduction histidine kinase
MSSESLIARAARLAAGLTVGVAVAVAALTFFGYRATREWQRSSVLLVERRAEEGAELLVTALTRDMRAAQVSVLASRDWRPLSPDTLTDTTDQVAATFARYPYPESFFGWRGEDDAQVLFFNRANRYPAWMPRTTLANRYPVVLVSGPPAADAISARIRDDAAALRRYSVFEMLIGSEPYQIVARLQYREPLREELENVFGYTVNLAWVRRSYFAEITSQVSRIGNGGINLDMAVLDERDGVVTGSHARPSATVRQFPLLFFDPSLIVLDPPADLAVRTWKVRVSAAANDPTLVWATRGSDWTFVLIAAAAIGLGASLVLTIRAVRASVALAELRSEFVSTVTHELKTPLATIRAVGDTLVRGRWTSADVLSDYAQILVQEAKRLTRLVDNLLAYARVTDVTEVYSFEPQAPAELIEDALQEFRQQLSQGGFELCVDVPHDLPLVRADRTAIRLALDNLLDNAIRYARTRRWIRLVAWRSGPRVYIEVQDRGAGIPADELAQVQRKFVRGRSAPAGGSGLGLAIVRRIVTDHGGTLTLESEVGAGTTARLDLPVLEA